MRIKSQGEIFQVSMIFGNFDNRRQAEEFVKEMKKEPMLIHSSVAIKGSWH